MDRRRFLAGGSAAAWALASAPGPAQAAPAGFPLTLPDAPLHDPWVVADAASGSYWLYTSNEARASGVDGLGVMVYRSTDLRHWSRPQPVFRLPSGVWANDGCWAPEVHRWRGRWVMFVTVHNSALALPGDGAGPAHRPYRRSTVLAVADRLDGPFVLLRDGEPVVSPAIMSLDGTLFTDRDGRPWMVYAHEWLQQRVGSMAAVPLDDELRATAPPQRLFWGDESPHALPQQGIGAVVTDGPQLHRHADGSLSMLWSSWGADGYFQACAHAASGELTGPWVQRRPWLGRGSGHGMLFRRFDGALMLVLHRPFNDARGKLYEVDDSGSGLSLRQQRVDLDLDPHPLAPAAG